VILPEQERSRPAEDAWPGLAADRIAHRVAQNRRRAQRQHQQRQQPTRAALLEDQVAKDDAGRDQKRIARQETKGSELNVNFVALDKKGRYGAAGSGRGFQYAITNQASSRVLPSADISDVGPRK